MPQLRVVVLDHTAQEGGAEIALLRAVTRLHGGDIEVRALLFEDGPFAARLSDAGIRTAVVPLDGRLNDTSRDAVLSRSGILRSAGSAAGFIPRLVRAIRSSHADLVVANSLKSAVFASIAAPLAGRRWVWHLHDRIAADYLPRPLVVAMRALASVGPRRIVVNSRATMQTLTAQARQRATIAYPGMDADAFRPAEPGSERMIGIIGRISPTKGQQEFLRAAAMVSAEHPDVRFLVVGGALFGEDAYERSVRALPAALGLSDRVEFTGWVPDARPYLRTLTALVHASPTPEPFGQVVVEAMAAGVPVVATAAGGVPEILDPDGEGGAGATALGILVPPGDVDALAAAILSILAQPEATAERAVAAKASAEQRFSIDSTVTVIRRAWRAAVGSHR